MKGRLKSSYRVIEYKLQFGEMEEEKGNLNTSRTFHMKPETPHVKVFQNPAVQSHEDKSTRGY